MTQHINRREFTRAQACVEGEILALGESRSIVGKTKNVSIGGMYFSCQKPFPAGTECRLVLFLDGADGKTRIEATGTVIRSGEDGLGIQFTAIELDSFQHLRNLILYNADETEEVEHEFKIHLGLKRRSTLEPDQNAA